jgi:phosphate transport system substrate-binding protein
MSTKTMNADALQFIQLRGSSTVLKVMQRIGSAYMDANPEVRLPLLGGGTAMGYKSVLDGTSDIGMASGQMPPVIESWATRNRLSIQSTTIAIDGLIPIVNLANPTNDLTLEQLHDIFTGKITNWSALGKFSGPINVVGHDPKLGTYETWKREVAGKDYVTLKAKVVNHLSELYSAITTDPHSIGYVGTTFLEKAKVKPLTIGGIAPTVENIQQKKYPIRGLLQLLTASNPSKEVSNFIAYCLDPNQGQAIIKDMGFVPIEKSS